MQPDLHICKNCNNSFSGKYCNHCGEKLYREKDKKVSHLFKFLELIHKLAYVKWYKWQILQFNIILISMTKLIYNVEL